MQALDTTIANVALPHMQGSLSATQEQISWVLTSYIVAAAIMTPPTGFLAGALRPQAAVPIRRRRLHRGVAALRPGADAAADGGVPLAAGRIRRRPGAAVPGGAAGHLSEGAARLRHGALGRRRDGGADPRADAGRLSHRVLRLALGVPDQPALRPDGLLRHPRLRAGDEARCRPRLRLLRLCHAEPGHRRATIDAGPRRGPGLVRLHRDHPRSLPRRPRHLSLPGADADRPNGPSWSRVCSGIATWWSGCCSSSSSASSCWRRWR